MYFQKEISVARFQREITNDNVKLKLEHLGTEKNYWLQTDWYNRSGRERQDRLHRYALKVWDCWRQNDLQKSRCSYDTWSEGDITVDSIIETFLNDELSHLFFLVIFNKVFLWHLNEELIIILNYKKRNFLITIRITSFLWQMM